MATEEMSEAREREVNKLVSQIIGRTKVIVQILSKTPKKANESAHELLKFYEANKETIEYGIKLRTVPTDRRDELDEALAIAQEVLRIIILQ